MIASVPPGLHHALDPGMDPSIFPENLEQMVMALQPWRGRSQFTAFLNTNIPSQGIPCSRFHVTVVDWISLHADQLDACPFQRSLSNPVGFLFEPARRSLLGPTRNETVWKLG